MDNKSIEDAVKRESLKMLMNEEKRKMNKAIWDVVIAIGLMVGSVFLFKHVLMSHGQMWGIPLMANLTWKQYWAFSILINFFVLWRSTEGTILENKVKDLEEKLGVQSKYSTRSYKMTYKWLAYTIGILFTWGMSALINTIWF